MKKVIHVTSAVFCSLFTHKFKFLLIWQSQRAALVIRKRTLIFILKLWSWEESDMVTWLILAILEALLIMIITPTMTAMCNSGSIATFTSQHWWYLLETTLHNYTNRRIHNVYTQWQQYIAAAVHMVDWWQQHLPHTALIFTSSKVNNNSHTYTTFTCNETILVYCSFNPMMLPEAKWC